MVGKMIVLGTALLAVFHVLDASCQSYYVDGEDVKAGNYVYEVKVGVGGLTLYLNNVESQWINSDLIYADGTYVTEDEYDRMVLGKLDMQTLEKAVMETFTEDEYRSLSDHKDQMTLLFVKSPEGRLAEVGFMIDASPRTLGFPPEKYALFEENMKKYVRFSVTEDEKQLRFSRAFYFLHFENLHLHYLKPGGGTPIGPDVELKE